MDEKAGKGKDFGSQRLDFQLLGGLQTLLKSLKEHHGLLAFRKVIELMRETPIEVSVLLTFHLVTSEKPLSIMKNT